MLTCLRSDAGWSRRLTVGYLGLAAVDTWLAGSRRPWAHRARLATKPLLMPVLAGSLLADPAADRSPLRGTTLAAQACGCAGDVALLGHGTGSFVLGAGAFGLGHLAYLAGFSAHRDRSTSLRRTRSARWASGLALVGGPVMALGAAREDRALAPAVLGYTGLLAGTLATAGHLDPALPAPARRLSLAGAVMFNLSDTVLAMAKFWWPTAPARTESVVMATYTAAQLLLGKGASAAAR